MENAFFKSRINPSRNKISEPILDVDKFFGEVQEFMDLLAQNGMNFPNSLLPLGDIILTDLELIEKNPQGFERFFKMDTGIQFLNCIFQVLESGPSKDINSLVLKLLIYILIGVALA